MGYEKPMGGTLRIKNPKTLRKWLIRGKFQELIDEGYTFQVGCGRFRVGICTCHKCRSGRGSTLQEMINEYYDNLNDIL